MTKYNKSKRKLILLNENTAVLFNIFHSDDDVESFVWYSDLSNDYPPDFAVEAANKFVKQLKDNGSPYFFKCLADKCMEEYNKWKREHEEKFREMVAKFEERKKEIENEGNLSE